MTIRNDTPLQYPITTRIVRVVLDSDWYPCSGCNATVLNYNNTALPLAQNESIWCFDPAGLITGQIEAIQDNGLYLPTGTNCTVWQPPDALDGHWELLACGEACAIDLEGSGSGSGHSGSGSSGSSSGKLCDPVPPYMRRWGNFDSTQAQVPGHDASGCFGWINVEACTGGGGGGGGGSGSSGSGSGGGGCSCTLLQVLTNSTNAGGLNITNVGTLAANLITVGSATLTISENASPTYTPSYTNPGGSGNRTLAITCSDSGVVQNVGGFTDQAFVDGYIADQWLLSGASAVGAWLKFDFGVGAHKLITEIKYYQASSVSQGTWKVQGSDNGSSWTDVSDTFNFGLATPPQVIPVSISGIYNTTGYRYYRLLGTAGLTNNGPYCREFQFKIADIGNLDSIQVSTASVNVGNLAIQPSGGTTLIGYNPVTIDNTGNVNVPGFFQSTGFQVGSTIYVDTAHNRMGIRTPAPGSMNGVAFVDAALQVDGCLVVDNLSGSTQGVGGDIYLGGYQGANYCRLNYNYGASILNIISTTVGGGAAITIQPDSTTVAKFTVAQALNLLLSSLPSGTLAAPPGGLNLGDVWLDTTTSAQYPIMRIRKT